MKNKYVKRSKISEAKFRNIIMYFCLELDSRKIAALTSLNRNTINRYLGRIRSRIVELCEAQTQVRQIGLPKAGRHPGGLSPSDDRKPVQGGLPIFGIRSRGNHIYTSLLPNAIGPQLRRFIKRHDTGVLRGVPGEWRHYDGIVDLNGRCHYRLGYLARQSDDGQSAAGQIEAFLMFARNRLPTFNLNGDDHFYLGLKECEFRFNNRHEDLYQLLLKRLRENPLN